MRRLKFVLSRMWQRAFMVFLHLFIANWNLRKLERLAQCQTNADTARGHVEEAVALAAGMVHWQVPSVGVERCTDPFYSMETSWITVRMHLSATHSILSTCLSIPFSFLGPAAFPPVPSASLPVYPRWNGARSAQHEHIYKTWMLWSVIRVLSRRLSVHRPQPSRIHPPPTASWSRLNLVTLPQLPRRFEKSLGYKRRGRTDLNPLMRSSCRNKCLAVWSDPL